MTPTRAVSIFAKLINDRELQCWDRLQGGCEYRAEVAAQRIRKMGYEPLKAWAFPEIRPDGRETFCLGQRRQAAALRLAAGHRQGRRPGRGWAAAVRVTSDSGTPGTVITK